MKMLHYKLLIKMSKCYSLCYLFTNKKEGTNANVAIIKYIILY